MSLVYVQFSDKKHVKIISCWSSSQTDRQAEDGQADEIKNYAEIESDDQRYVDWFAEMKNILPDYMVESFVAPGG